MFPLNETHRSSAIPSPKIDFITSLRRLTSKSKRGPAQTHPEEYVPRHTRISSLTMEPVTRTLHSAGTSSSPPRRVRMSGSRPPSGYRPHIPPRPASAPSPKPLIEPQQEPTPTHREHPPPLRTRITRLLPINTARATLSTSTPTSSTLSFPSSSRASSTSTTTSSAKTVRFSPSTSFVKSSKVTQQRNQEQDNVEERGKVSIWSRRTTTPQSRNGPTNGER